jgi:hypothetical protein
MQSNMNNGEEEMRGGGAVLGYCKRLGGKEYERTTKTGAALPRHDMYPSDR